VSEHRIGYIVIKLWISVSVVKVVRLLFALHRCAICLVVYSTQAVKTACYC